MAYFPTHKYSVYMLARHDLYNLNLLVIITKIQAYITGVEKFEDIMPSQTSVYATCSNALYRTCIMILKEWQIDQYAKIEFGIQIR